MEEIKEKDFQVVYDPVAQKIVWSGIMRLREEEYRPVSELLTKVVDSKAADLTIDLRELSFLNSSGINVLSRFLLQLRNQTSNKITIQANQAHSWQRKSLNNMQRLMHNMKMDLIWE